MAMVVCDEAGGRWRLRRGGRREVVRGLRLGERPRKRDPRETMRRAWVLDKVRKGKGKNKKGRGHDGGGKEERREQWGNDGGRRGGRELVDGG
ncbi:hypothetical protein GOBAR_AA09818 [Gossypium barbadense]|uniref:Uncharacterized protein n=1 Tax=Gossypium barbadense TaxID=3634 RepID=A0A2P5Y5I3_GOSBA|nr:hypothetical protein GOBAR_AA09818 [Gossypium barbadense]